MTNQLQTFEFHSHQLRVIPDENGAPWFIAKDVCDILEYGNAARTIKQLCRESGILNRYIPELSNTYQLINEGNLYRLVIKSTKPEAEPFESWVFDEVLPSIRKTGGYGIPDFLKPITAPISVAEFEQRHQILTQAFIDLKAAQIYTVMTGADLLARRSPLKQSSLFNDEASASEKVKYVVRGKTGRSNYGYKPWSEEELQELRDCYAANMLDWQIAQKLDRSASSIRSQWSKMRNAAKAGA